MKFKLIPIFIFVLIIFSCKPENKENNSVLEPAQSTTKESLSDSIKSDSAEVKSSSNDLSKNKKLLLDFYIKNDKKPEFFLINTNRDTTIVCSEKTRITIKANSFVSLKTKKDITGKIKISVKEYYKISDILLGRLSTASNGKLLETGGMLDINVISNQEKCDLKKGKSIEIEFPRKIKKEGMQLFNGSWKNDQINWQLVENSVDLNKIFTKVEEMPVYPGGNEKMYQFLGRSIKLPETDISGKVYTSFVIDKNGNVTDIKITKGLSKEIDDAVVRGLEKLLKFNPGKINGLPVNVAYSLPITISSPYEDGYTATSKNNTASYFKNNAIKNSKAVEINYYLFKSTRLGLINCDRFWDSDESSKINYVVNFKNDSDTSVNIIFHRIKSIMNEYSDTNTVSFNNVPSGEKITIFAVKYFDHKPYLAIQKTETSAQNLNNLVFQEVTGEKLKEEMKKLNRFN